MFDGNRARPRAFTGPQAEQRAERCGMWLKGALARNPAAASWCAKNGVPLVPLTRASGEGVDGGGGFLVPQDFYAAISALRDTVGGFRRGAQVLPATSDNQVRPRRVGGLTMNFVAEGAPIPESSFLLDAIEATPKKLAGLARSSSELWEDSAPNLAEFLAVEFAYALAAREDDCGFNGDGTSAFGGMTGLGTKLAGLKSAVAAATGHNTFLTLDAVDIANLMAGVLTTAIPTAAWYTSATGYAQTICRLAQTSGALVAEMGPAGLEANYLGHPIIFTSKLPDVATGLVGKPMLFFGDLAMSSAIVERRGLVVASSPHPALSSDQVLTRGVAREVVVNHTVGDASTRGPVAMLVGTT